MRIMKAIRWRLNDLGEENHERWTRVHYLRSDDVTLCSIEVPPLPYMIDYDNDIPVAALRCQRCVRVAKRATS